MFLWLKKITLQKLTIGVACATIIFGIGFYAGFLKKQDGHQEARAILSDRFNFTPENAHLYISSSHYALGVILRDAERHGEKVGPVEVAEEIIKVMGSDPIGTCNYRGLSCMDRKVIPEVEARIFGIQTLINQARELERELEKEK